MGLCFYHSVMLGEMWRIWQGLARYWYSNNRSPQLLLATLM